MLTVSSAKSRICIIIGLGRLVGKSEEEYIKIAIGLASDVSALQDLHMSLRDLMLKSPLCNRDKFILGLESAYRNMWHRYCRGDVPSLSRVELLKLDNGLPVPVKGPEGNVNANGTRNGMLTSLNLGVNSNGLGILVSGSSSGSDAGSSTRCNENGHAGK
jgi:protein O-GlcNAc transferase